MALKAKTTRWLLVLVLLAVTIFPAGVQAAPGDVTGIEIEGTSKVELTIGGSAKQLKLLAATEGSTVKKDVTGAASWTSSDTGVVEVSAGLLKAKNSGTATVRATHGTAIATIEVTVAHPYKNLKIEHSGGSYKLGDSGETLQVKATATGGSSAAAVNDVTKDAVWSSSDSSVLTITEGTIKLIGEGSSTITAKYAGLTATFKATVTLPYSSVVVMRDGHAVKELEMLVGDSEAVLTAVTKSSGGTESAVTEQGEWSSSVETVATVDKGIIKPLAIGHTVITFKYLGVSQTVNVYVRAPYEALLFSPSDDQSMFIGETVQVKAEVRNGINTSSNVSGSVTWSSGSPLAATVTAGGEAAAIAAKAVGSSVIKGDYLGLTRNLKVTVYPTLTELTLEKDKLEIYNGESAALPKVTGKKLDGTKMDFSPEIEWTSSNEEVALVKDGKITAATAGEAVITGKIRNTGITSAQAPIREKSVSFTVTVNEKVLLLLGPDRDTLVMGDETGLPQITAVYENGYEEDVTAKTEWTLSNANAVIKQTATGKTIKGLKKGSVTLKGTYSNKTISIPLAVEQKVVKLVVDPARLDLNLKGSKSIKVTGYYSDGKTVNLSSKMNWQSADMSVVTINGSTAKSSGIGTTLLTGSYQGISATVNVSVTPKLTGLTVDEKRLALAPGAARKITVTAFYDTGASAVVNGGTVWTTSKSSVAKVAADGTVTAVGKGTASIKGKFGNKTVTVSVTVK